MALIDDIKRYLGITTSDSDTELTRLSNAALALAERLTGQTLTSAAATEYYDGDGGNRIFLFRAPVTTITTVTVDGSTVPESTSWSTSGWWRDGNALRLRGYTFSTGEGNVEVNYTAGYSTIPADLNQAVVQLCGTWWQERARLGQQSKDIGQETITFHPSMLTPSIKAVFESHRRICF